MHFICRAKFLSWATWFQFKKTKFIASKNHKWNLYKKIHFINFSFSLWIFFYFFSIIYCHFCIKLCIFFYLKILLFCLILKNTVFHLKKINNISSGTNICVKWYIYYKFRKFKSNCGRKIETKKAEKCLEYEIS